MKRFFVYLRATIRHRFNLNDDKGDEAEIVASIRRDVSFKGTNLWTLIFAIFIASIGLNVNSTAVIIGAMLISPLMGPIMGVGLAIGTNDFQLLKTGIKNLTIAVIASILTSACYFYLTPLHEASSELLARTNPSLWDVFIAFLGGLAGIVAGTRKSKSNVIPGVAIATALMPPLCTVGFGLAMGRWYYFFGALYLFFINSVFICVATYLIVRHLRFKKHEFETASRRRRVLQSIWLIVAVALLPSVYLAYRIVQKSIFEGNAKKFVQGEFHFARTQVISRSFKMEGGGKSIELLLIGEELPVKTIDSLRGKLAGYKLRGTTLTVRQGLTANSEVDVAQIRASILDDVFKQKEPADTTARPSGPTPAAIPDLRNELRSLYPTLTAYTLSQEVIINLQSARQDTVSLFTASFSQPISRTERARLAAWLKQRIPTDSVRLLAE